jgi:Fe(3+) dicitrate transport protein
VTERAKLFGGVHNLFDEQYTASRHPHGPRPGMPRFLFVGMEVTF